MSRILIIGGGAAGMMASVFAARNGHKVHIFEKNEKTGKKLFITGKGRCNLTNGCNKEEFFHNLVSNEKFLYSAFSRMDNQGVKEFFEKAGCALKKERGERIFPLSDHSSDVIAALNGQMARNQVKVSLNSSVSQILMEKGGSAKGQPHVCGVKLKNGNVIKADAVIVATGGKSYEATGSTGDGYAFAAEAGHSIRELKPSLVPLAVDEGWCSKLQGLSLKNVSVAVVNGKKKIYQGFGEMLFTHFGVSGPLVLSASSYYAKKCYGMRAGLFIDLKPALSAEQLDRRLLRDFEENKNRQFKNALDGLLPTKMIPVMVNLSGILPEKKINEVTREERARLAGLLKKLPLTVTGTRGFQEAIITQGGVHVKEVNPSTMESRLVKGLYFAGEVLDLDALTGGFNLQIAWSTGYLAGCSASGEE